jgi:hypothetical protein
MNHRKHVKTMFNDFAQWLFTDQRDILKGLIEASDLRGNAMFAASDWTTSIVALNSQDYSCERQARATCTPSI